MKAQLVTTAATTFAARSRSKRGPTAVALGALMALLSACAGHPVTCKTPSTHEDLWDAVSGLYDCTACALSLEEGGDPQACAGCLAVFFPETENDYFAKVKPLIGKNGNDLVVIGAHVGLRKEKNNGITRQNQRLGLVVWDLDHPERGSYTYHVTPKHPSSGTPPDGVLWYAQDLGDCTKNQTTWCWQGDYFWQDIYFGADKGFSPARLGRMAFAISVSFDEDGPDAFCTGRGYLDPRLDKFSASDKDKATSNRDVEEMIYKMTCQANGEWSNNKCKCYGYPALWQNADGC